MPAAQAAPGYDSTGPGRGTTRWLSFRPWPVSCGLRRTLLRWAWAGLCLAAAGPVQAHLMVAQKGTLNLVNGGAFLVLSLPVSAFAGVDDDGDGRLSSTEMSAHVNDIGPRVQQGVQLLSPAGPLPLEGMLFSLSPPDNDPSGPAPHLVVMGRFALPPAWGPAAASAPSSQATAQAPLALRVSLFGTTPEQQRLDLTVTRVPEVQHLRFEPGREQHALFPSAPQVMADHVVIGAEHVLTGLDHLLFLWVMVTACTGWRALVLALTSFTLGHALTLVACVLAGWSAPASVVEPAIALTIVGMALLDRTVGAAPVLGSSVASQASSTTGAGRFLRWPVLRLLLVFGCALVHGLALSGALMDLGLDRRHLAYSLLGFNLGVEAAQLAVGAAAIVGLAAVARLGGQALRARVLQASSTAAIGVGLVWLLQRLMP